MSMIEKFYVVNLKYAVAALKEIRDLDPGLWKTGQHLAQQALNDMDHKLVEFIDEELERDKQELITRAREGR